MHVKDLINEVGFTTVIRQMREICEADISKIDQSSEKGRILVNSVRRHDLQHLQGLERKNNLKMLHEQAERDEAQRV